MKTNHYKEITVALAGNPNSGKTSIFNELSGAKQKIGNFSGVTVEKYQETIKFGQYRINVVDLPGTYGLSAFSPEEVITRNYIIKKKPDIVINVLDATNLERNLLLTMQLIELECKLIIALNFSDEIEKQGQQINVKQLESLMGVKIISTSARKKTGIGSLLSHIILAYENEEKNVLNKISYTRFIEDKINHLADMIKKDPDLADLYPARWLAVKLLENDKIVQSIVFNSPLYPEINTLIEETKQQIHKACGTDAEMLITEGRYSIIQGAIRETVRSKGPTGKNITGILDKILINRVTGLPLFVLVMWLMFQLIFSVGNIPAGWIEQLFGWAGDLVKGNIHNIILKSVLADGIIAGVGGVLVYLPIILLLFLVLTFIEASGYMARVAFVIDKVMHVFGLHGKSAIPLLTGFGCSIPAFMSTRILKNKSDRITTLLIIPFISCSAKLPVFTLIIGAFFKPAAAGNLMLLIYLFGILMALFSALFFKSTFFKGESEPFVMELPPYRMPNLKTLWYQVWERSGQYLKKAGTVILLASVIIWFGSNFPKDLKTELKYQRKIDSLELVKNNQAKTKQDEIASMKTQLAGLQIRNSLLGRTGKLIEPVIKPLGFDWRLGISLISGIASKEVIIATLGTTYSLYDKEGDNHENSLRSSLQTDRNYNKLTGVSLILFILLYIPCIPSSAVFHREAGSWKWTAVYITYTIGVAWVIAFTAYHFSGLFF